MDNCKKIEKKLMMYFYDVLTQEEKKEIQKHLHYCKICSEKFIKLQKANATLNKPSFYKAPDRFDTILKKAKERKTYFNNIIKSIFFINILKRIKRKSWIGLITTIVIIMLGIWFFPYQYNKLYIIKASGNIHLNRQSFFNNYQFKYELNNKTDINIGHGECIFQIEKDYLIVLREDTHIEIQKRTNININLLKGTLIGQVLKKKNKKSLIISSKNVKFEIKGTTFFINRNKNYIECAVEKGVVKSTINNKEYFIKKNEKIRITDKYILPIKKVLKRNALFNRLKILPLYKNFHNMRKIIIKTMPISSYVYWKNINMGNTPFFLLRKKEIADQFFITHKGYISKGINLSGKDDSIEIHLKKKTKPIYLWSKKLENEIFTKPYHISQFIIKKSEGSFYKIDITNEKLNKNISDRINIIKGKDKKNIFLKGLNSTMTWSQKLKNTVFVKPYYINQFLVLTDVRGMTYKINLTTGKILWTFYPGVRMSSQVAYYKERLYISYNDDFLYAIDFETGKIIWRARTGTLVYSAPQYYKDRLYTCNNEGFLFCLDSTNGKILWRKKLDKGFFTSPVIEKGNLYVGGLSGKLYSINLKKRKVNWTFTSKGRIIDSTPLIYGDLIIVGSNDKHLYAINKKTGNLKWKFYTGGEIFTSPVKIEDCVIITTIRGNVYSVSIEEGKKKWQYNTQEKILMTPQVIDNKYIYIGTEQKIVVLNKWGLLYMDYIKPLITFIALNKENIFLCGDNNYLYNVNLNWFNEIVKK